MPNADLATAPGYGGGFFDGAMYDADLNTGSVGTSNPGIKSPISSGQPVQNRAEELQPDLAAAEIFTQSETGCRLCDWFQKNWIVLIPIIILANIIFFNKR